MVANSDDNAEDLLSDNRKHFQFDTIELVEACPCTGRGETLEELTHRFVV